MDQNEDKNDVDVLTIVDGGWNEDGAGVLPLNDWFAASPDCNLFSKLMILVFCNKY